MKRKSSRTRLGIFLLSYLAATCIYGLDLGYRANSISHEGFADGFYYWVLVPPFSFVNVLPTFSLYLALVLLAVLLLRLDYFPRQRFRALAKTMEPREALKPFGLAVVITVFFAALQGVIALTFGSGIHVEHLDAVSVGDRRYALAYLETRGGSSLDREFVLLECRRFYIGCDVVDTLEPNPIAWLVEERAELAYDQVNRLLRVSQGDVRLREYLMSGGRIQP